MGCETCQDCSCDNITLPVAIGATGATGATGPAGANGIGGEIVLFNNMTSASTNSLVIGDLTGMTYTLPIDKLATDGSKLKLNAYFRLNPSVARSGALVEVHVAGVNITVNPQLFMMSKITTTMKLEVTFLRKSNVLLYAECLKREGDYSSGMLLATGHMQQLITNIVPNDLDTITNIIKLRGNVFTATDTLVCEYMSVELFLKQ